MSNIKHVVNFSGGMGSFAEAKACVDKFGKENVTLLFADTMMEDEDLYRFKDECVDFLGCELVTIADGRTPFDVFKDVRFMGNSRVDPCSKILKRELLNKWIGDNYAFNYDAPVLDEFGRAQFDEMGRQKFYVENNITCQVHLGIDFSEHHRLTRLQERMAPWTYRSTLVEDGRIVHKGFSEQFGIKRPRLYDWKLGHNNCGGFCIKAGLGHYKALHEASPERYAEFEAKEADVYQSIGAVYPFLKKTEDKVLKRLTLKQYREEYLEPKLVSQEDSQEYGGCGCAI